VRSEDDRVIQPITINGKHFELTLRQQPCGQWHWLMTAPGQLVLSGDAASEAQALEVAHGAGQTLAQIAAA
jgi:hypothetical protein